MPLTLPDRSSTSSQQPLRRPIMARNNQNLLTFDPNAAIKKGIWVYFLLVLFEGALRKWFLPFLATPLLVIRDPVAIWVIIKAIQARKLPTNVYLNGIVAIGAIGIVTALFIGHGNIFVALFGARILLFHFPLMFVIGAVFDREDVIRMGKVTLLVSIPMAILIGLQFYSPQSSFVNLGVGADESGAGFSGIGDFFRPPGTFSFTNGTTLFFGFACCFILFFWFNIKLVNKLALLAATGGLIAAIPLSISRALLFQIVFSVAFLVIAIARKPKYFGKLVIGSIAIVAALAIMSSTSFFQTATGAFNGRFESANDAEGGLNNVIFDRVLGTLVGTITSSLNLPFFGFGIGMGTNVGSMLLTGDNNLFLIAEGEWARMLGEVGPLMGLTVIFLRLSLTVKMGLASFRKLAKDDLLPWLIASSGLLLMAQGGWSQPTSLGFCTLTGGLLIASLNDRKEAAPKP